MNWPLTIRIWYALRRAVKALSEEGREAMLTFVRSQKRNGGYCGPGGQVEPYYTQFGNLLENVLVGRLVPRVKPLVIAFGDERKNENGIYSLFFRFLNDELHLHKTELDLLAYRLPTGGYIHVKGRPEASTNATCAALAMLYRRGTEDEPSVEWLLSLQDETGGFRATVDAPIPDLLSTSVAVFTLSLYGRKPLFPIVDFVESHWLGNGGFSPTLLDEYSDVEYVFYGLLALGSICE